MSTFSVRFKKVLKDQNGDRKFSYLFQGFEGVYSRWELPCEYLSGLHFASWNEILLYSDGQAFFSLVPGSEISESKYLELLTIFNSGEKRLKEIRGRIKN